MTILHSFFHEKVLNLLWIQGEIERHLVQGCRVYNVTSLFFAHYIHWMVCFIGTDKKYFDIFMSISAIFFISITIL